MATAKRQHLQRLLRVRRYLRSSLRADAMAGLTVAVMGVPQAMAYALIAGLPPVYGLYTAAVTCVVAALFGSSNHLITGPTNALCMVILSLTAHLPEKYGVSLLEIILLLTVMVGIIQLGFGLLRLGAIVRYVSNSVVVGFTAGAGLLIAANQLQNLFGLRLEGVGQRFFQVLWATLSNLAETNPRALVVGLLTAITMVLVAKVNRRMPASLIGVVVASLIVVSFNWHVLPVEDGKLDIVMDIEPIRGDWNIFHVPVLLRSPEWGLTRELLTGAVALALLGLLEAASIARAIAARSGQRLDFSREFVGQGAGNLVGGFFSCFAGSGSFTRSAVCFQAGGRSRGGAMFSAAWTVAAVAVFAPLANYIPKAALAGLLLVVAYSMIDKHRMMLAWKAGWNSRWVLFGTFGATLVMPLEYAIFVGVALSVIILLQITGRTDLTQLVPRPDMGFDEVPFNRAAPSPVVTINLEGDLYFAAVDDLDYELLRCITPETRVVVLRMKRLRAVGSTAMAMLEHFYHLLKERKLNLIVCGIEDELAQVMTNSGLRREIGEENIFYADNRLFQSTELALSRAWSLVQEEQRSRSGSAARERTQAAEEITARMLYNPRSVRFGAQHQLREAIWLMTGMHRRSSATSPHALFLQNREGKLAGCLTPQRVFEIVAKAYDQAEDRGGGEAAFRTVLGSALQRSISELARKDLPHIEVGTPLATLLEIAVKDRHSWLPVCDREGRIQGVLTANDLLRGVRNFIQRQKAAQTTDEP